MITLSRPLVALDVETHAKSSPEEARIVEIGFHMEYPDGRPPKQWVSFVKPDLLITPEATEVHGIDNAAVATAPTFKQLAPSFARGFVDCDYCGYNILFDIRVLKAEMKRAGVPWSTGDGRFLDSFRIWRAAEPRTLSDAVRRFLGREPSKAHRAFEDAKDALDVAMAQLAAFSQLPTDLQGLHDLCFAAEKNFVDPDGKFQWVDGDAVCQFGKHRNVRLQRLPKKYLHWITTGDFSPEVKELARDAMMGKFPVRTTTPVQTPAAVAAPASVNLEPEEPRMVPQTSLFD